MKSCDDCNHLESKETMHCEFINDVVLSDDVCWKYDESLRSIASYLVKKCLEYKENESCQPPCKICMDHITNNKKEWCYLDSIKGNYEKCIDGVWAFLKHRPKGAKNGK